MFRSDTISKLPHLIPPSLPLEIRITPARASHGAYRHAVSRRLSTLSPGRDGWGEIIVSTWEVVLGEMKSIEVRGWESRVGESRDDVVGEVWRVWWAMN